MLRIAIVCAGLAVGAVATLAPAFGQDDEAYRATLQDIEATWGFVPTFIQQFPKAALPAAWAELKAVELSETTAVPPKYKALISLAVSAQIPCAYCIWLDTASARQLGATDEEIQEAVAMASLTRYWSTFFNGMQVDFDLMKREFGGEAADVGQRQ
jgi:AhpD family alkylhydroperoxidase